MPLLSLVRRIALISGVTLSFFANAAEAPQLGRLLETEDFKSGLDNWIVEAQQPGKVEARDGVLEIDVPAGLTLWYRKPLLGRVAISFDATAVSAGGANDRVSDLNVFWMAHEKGDDPDVTPMSRVRNGAFAEYDDLLTYYVGLGGNANSTTRFRRYIGQPGNRPLLPEHDLSAKDTLLVPNRSQHITIISDHKHIAYYRDGVRLFAYEDPKPYTTGWFAFRTVKSHLRISNFKVWSMVPNRRDALKSMGKFESPITYGEEAGPGNGKR